jgi:hypothetical protein
LAVILNRYRYESYVSVTATKRILRGILGSRRDRGGTATDVGVETGMGEGKPE